MIVVRNVFQLKFGKAREALANMKEGVAIQKRIIGDSVAFSTRLLTDATGPFYTLVLELTVPNLAALEAALQSVDDLTRGGFGLVLFASGLGFAIWARQHRSQLGHSDDAKGRS